MEGLGVGVGSIRLQGFRKLDVRARIPAFVGLQDTRVGNELTQLPQKLKQRQDLSFAPLLTHAVVKRNTLRLHAYRKSWKLNFANDETCQAVPKALDLALYKGSRGVWYFANGNVLLRFQTP